MEKITLNKELVEELLEKITFGRTTETRTCGRTTLTINSERYQPSRFSEIRKREVCQTRKVIESNPEIE